MQDGFSGQFFRIFKIYCFAIAILDQVQDVEAIFQLPKQLTASENLF